MRRFLLCLLMLVLLPWPAVAGQPLRIGVSEWIPWIIKEKAGYTGIVVEVCKEAIRRAGYASVTIEVPQKRRDLAEWGRSVDIEPGCEKAWRIRYDEVSVYTAPYLQTRNVIVTRKGTHPGITAIKDFYGKTIGANAGYYYTDGLSRAFDQGLIRRDDCGPGHNLISKLVKKRFNAIVADTYEWKYWMKHLGQDLSRFEESYRFSHMNNLRIRLHRDKAGLVGPLNRALEEMKADQTITRIVSRFLTACPVSQEKIL